MALIAFFNNPPYNPESEDFKTYAKQLDRFGKIPLLSTISALPRALTGLAQLIHGAAIYVFGMLQYIPDNFRIEQKGPDLREAGRFLSCNGLKFCARAVIEFIPLVNMSASYLFAKPTHRTTSAREERAPGPDRSNSPEYESLVSRSSPSYSDSGSSPGGLLADSDIEVSP